MAEMITGAVIALLSLMLGYHLNKGSASLLPEEPIKLKEKIEAIIKPKTKPRPGIYVRPTSEELDKLRQPEDLKAGEEQMIESLKPYLGEPE